MEYLSDFLFQYSHLGVFLALLACGLGLPIPEDIILVTAGVIAAGNHTLIWMNVIGMAGVLIGDSIIYTLGYRFGEKILQRRPFSWLVTPERLRKVRQYYRKYGYWAIFMSRFLAGLRATSFLLAGLSHVPYRRFLAADGVAALVSVPFWICLGYYFSEDIEGIFEKIKTAQTDVLVAGAVIVVLFLIIRWLLRRRQARLESTSASKAQGQEMHAASEIPTSHKRSAGPADKTDTHPTQKDTSRV